MSVKLRDFIRSIRACKTAAEERAFIAKECALMRTAFKEGDSNYRSRNVAKLLFIHMMGYPTHFAQLECLKLIASSRFSEKRIGYLALNQVLDENTEILMLVTNSIKNDLNHASQYVVGLALAAVGNMAPPEMCRSLAKEVEDLCGNSNPYTRKKALLCAVRLVYKIEEVSERFLPVLPTVFEDKNHGVLLAGCSLLDALLDTDVEGPRDHYARFVPQLVACLKRVVELSGYSTSAEYDVGGVTDPFLQVKLLRTLRSLHQAVDCSNEDVADILSQIASTTESSKGSGNAVLLECAATIMAVTPDASLKTLGVNILGRFLQNRDTNIRYVALSALQQLVKIDVDAVQRHRATVIECLKDPDTSICRRALDVVCHLVNEETLFDLFKEMLALLTDVSGNDAADGDLQKDVVSKICLAIDKFSPDRQWQIDSTIRVLALAGDVAPVDIRNSLIYLVAASPELHAYGVSKVFFAAKEFPTQEVLTQVAIWAVGEYGDVLISSTEITPMEVLDFLEGCAGAGFTSGADSPTRSGKRLVGGSALLETTPSSASCTQEMLLTALIKLSVRIPTEKGRIQRFLRRFDASIIIDLQQRSCEYQELLGPNWDSIRSSLLDRMALPTEAAKSSRPAVSTAPSRPSVQAPASGADLLDLNGFLDVPTANSYMPASPIAAVPEAASPNVEDLLSDLFGSSPAISNMPSVEQASPSRLPLDSLL